MTRVVAVLLLAMLAGCAHDQVRPTGPADDGTSSDTVTDNIQLPQSERYALEEDSGPDEIKAALAHVAALPDPVPRVEPRSRYGNGPVYTVLGETYHVLPTARGYHARGMASWYGMKFQGHLTSSLEPYDMFKFTAAHKTLPLPTWVRVTNLGNGKSVVVRVNDRGPFHGHRLIDLSWAAAVRLDMWKDGTARVDVRAINVSDGEPVARVAVTNPKHEPALYLQVGAYARADNARSMRDRLRRLGIADAGVHRARVDGRQLSRVRIGPLQGGAELQQVQRLLDRHHIPAVKVEIQSSSEE